LTAIQKAMFKAMTKSTTIPHFGFSDEIVLNASTKFRKATNDYLKVVPYKGITKISYMPIFLKAISCALIDFPILNACILNPESVKDAKIQYRSSHNIGIAMDTPQGYTII
jgi:2-oxoisovalerate dehydrogenase E2 component (dihydrolipoyl transacylase)